ncbi:aldehyde dehydrogenase (NADP(+)) [Nocardiopsis salina]|uniref:aldehyde dehydrogenase (NADP(+)) n=1 Tax=Nocardiopsis salina TaxID=245836 RepID=UPI00034C25E8|nr:aldehyde dehydrogenase (NADP(+)) [Nocardiopsis salina]
MTRQIENAVTRAQEALERTRSASPAEVEQWLEAAAAALEAHAEELVLLAAEETHLPEGRLRGELTRTVFQLRLLGAETASGRHLDATVDHADDAWPMGPRPDLRRVNVPLGVVGVFGASNFPFAFSVMGGDSASALAAGCPVVHKVHEAHERLGMRTADVITKALEAASAPEGLFTAVTGRESGTALVNHPAVAAIGFTGSARVGRLLFDQACARPEPIPFFGELGSTNPAFVTERAWASRREEILRGYAGSVTLGMGQFCTNPGLLFVPALDQEARKVLSAELSEAPRFPMLTDRLAADFGETLDAVAGGEGVETVLTGEPGRSPGPTILTTTAEHVHRKPGLLGEELFGPAGLVVEYGTEDRLGSLAALVGGQLTATIHSETDEDPGPLVRLLEARAGRVLMNGWPTGVTVSHAQQHGGPYPATTAPGTTSVGTAAVRRFLRPVAYQSFPDAQLPPALQEDNPWRIPRRTDGGAS